MAMINTSDANTPSFNIKKINVSDIHLPIAIKKSILESKSGNIYKKYVSQYMGVLYGMLYGLSIIETNEYNDIEFEYIKSSFDKLISALTISEKMQDFPICCMYKNVAYSDKIKQKHYELLRLCYENKLDVINRNYIKSKILLEISPFKSQRILSIFYTFDENIGNAKYKECLIYLLHLSTILNSNEEKDIYKLLFSCLFTIYIKNDEIINIIRTILNTAHHINQLLAESIMICMGLYGALIGYNMIQLVYNEGVEKETENDPKKDVGNMDKDNNKEIDKERNGEMDKECDIEMDKGHNKRVLIEGHKMIKNKQENTDKIRHIYDTFITQINDKIQHIFGGL